MTPKLEPGSAADLQRMFVSVLSAPVKSLPPGKLISTENILGLMPWLIVERNVDTLFVAIVFYLLFVLYTLVISDRRLH
jgi:hypothetical protein